MTKALVFGAGAVGSIYGWILHKAGAEVTVACRSNHDAVKAHGFTIHSAVFGDVHYAPATVRTPDEAQPTGPFDYIFVCTKALPGLGASIASVVGPETAVVVAQNGIAVEHEYAALYPANTIISGVVWLPASQLSPGVVHMGRTQRLELGTYPAAAPAAAKARVQRLSELFAAAGAHAPAHDDVQGMRWAKLAINCAFNPICALTRCDSGNLLVSSPAADAMVVSVLREVGGVAAAEGYDVLSEETIQARMADYRARMKSGSKDPSMLTDVKAGRSMEVEAIVGNTVRIAGKHGLEVPRLEMLYALATALNFSTVRTDAWVPTVF